MKYIVTTLFFLISSMLFAQRENHLAFPETDSLYREDQFYISATFHLITDRPSGIQQSGFSGGLHAGFIRDFPINKRRNWSIGAGLGYSINIYNHNLILQNIDNKTVFRAPSTEDDIKNNRFKNQIIEVPLELRWRTSTFKDYKFWRVYTGVKLGYMHSFSYELQKNNDTSVKLRNPDGLERLRMGATFTFGFNTFNFHVYYGLNPFFDKSVTIENQQGGFSNIKFGLMFYIL